MNAINQPVLIAIHGLGKKRSRDFDLLVAGMSPFVEVVTFDLYELDEPNPNQTQWVKRAIQVVEQYQHRDIYLLGFSMGGVIACYLACHYRIKRLILVAPAFEYPSLAAWGRMLKQLCKQALRQDRLQRALPLSYVNEFQILIHAYRPWVKYVMCPTLLIHALGDEVIDIHSSYYVLKHLPGADYLWLPDSRHEVLLDPIHYQTIMRKIQVFLGD